MYTHTCSSQNALTGGYMYIHVHVCILGFHMTCTAAMLVSPNIEMVAMLVSRSNPPGIESYYYANVFFCFR